MLNPQESLKRPRSLAFSHQNGRCYYRNMHMWTKDSLEFTLKYKVTRQQVKYLQCTGEHLTAQKDGGTSAQHNIVAACYFFNLRRHRPKRKVDPTREQYKKLVQQGMAQGGWHPF